MDPGKPVQDGAGGTPGLPLADEGMSQRLEALRRRLAAAARRVCPPWLARDAEDIVQNVLVQLSRAGLLGEEELRLSSMYLQKAAYGAAVDEIRRRCRRREIQLAEDDSLRERGLSGAADPERMAASAEIGRGIQECLRALIRPRRLAVTLHLQGCSVPETASRLGWEAKRTENLAYRGLADLRRCLLGKGLAP